MWKPNASRLSYSLAGFLLRGQGAPPKRLLPLKIFKETIERRIETIAYCWENNCLLSPSLNFFRAESQFDGFVVVLSSGKKQVDIRSNWNSFVVSEIVSSLGQISEMKSYCLKWDRKLSNQAFCCHRCCYPVHINTRQRDFSITFSKLFILRHFVTSFCGVLRLFGLSVTSINI